MINLRKLMSPELKRWLKIFFHKVHRIRHGLPLIATNLEIKEIGDPKSDVFFGYYDICPYGPNDETLLYHRRSKDKEIDICIFDLNTKQEEKLAVSSAWNWQQGSRLRWFNENSVSFNDYKNNNYINRIVNIHTKEERQLDFPLYDISPDNKLGLTLNFERLGYLRPGYGYRCIGIDQSSFGNQGIDIVSIEENKIISVLELSAIHKFLKSETPLEKCYINHLSFSPDSKSFLFFFVEIINGYHKASLIVFDIPTGQFKILENRMKVSHYVWYDSNTILCSAYTSPSDCKYYIYNVTDGDKEKFLPNLLAVDGHPSYLSDDVIITDTYPNANGYQKLYRVNIKLHEAQDLLQIYSVPVLNGEKRTDLHPRINHNKNKICIDACIKTHRKIYEIKIV